MATVASAVAAAAAVSTMDVPESQRLIAVSLGKIAASRGQKGGINLHKNLLVATVLTKARTAYMIQHMNAARQRAAQAASVPVSSPSPLSSSPQCMEMNNTEYRAEQTQSAPSTTTTTTTPTTSPSPVAHPPSPSCPANPQSVTQGSPSSWVPESAAGSCAMQVAECEDKENTPPPSSSSCSRDASCVAAPALSTTTITSQDCEKRLQGDVDNVKEHGKPALCSRPVVSHQTGQQQQQGDHVSRPSTTCCLLKRRRAMDRDHENVSAPKVRIVESRVSFESDSSSLASSTSTVATTCASSGFPEPMQCVDSPQISNLVNIFNTSFSGLASDAGSSLTYCAKEMKVSGGLDSVHQPSLLLSV